MKKNHQWFGYIALLCLLFIGVGCAPSEQLQMLFEMEKALLANEFETGELLSRSSMEGGTTFSGSPSSAILHLYFEPKSVYSSESILKEFETAAIENGWGELSILSLDSDSSYEQFMTLKQEINDQIFSMTLIVSKGESSMEVSIRSEQFVSNRK